MALDETVLEVVETTVPLQRTLMDEPGFVEGGTDIHHLEHWIAAANKASTPS